MTWFKLHSEKWITGSTRWELSLEERSIWLDFLALASLNNPPGRFNYFSLKQLSDQIRAPRKKIENAMRKFVDFKKISIDSTENLVIIENWQKYQSEYLRQKPYRSPEKQKENCNKVTTRDVTKLPVDKSRLDENRVVVQGTPPDPGETHFNTKFEFIKRLRIIEEELEQETDNSQNERLFDFLLKKYRSLDPIRELDAIRELFKKNPGEVKTRIKAGKSLIDQLYALFEKAAEYAGLKG